MEGQGAPLTPIFHKLIVNENFKITKCNFINIGGIANCDNCYLKKR